MAAPVNIPRRSAQQPDGIEGTFPSMAVNDQSHGINTGREERPMNPNISAYDTSAQIAHRVQMHHGIHAESEPQRSPDYITLGGIQKRAHMLDNINVAHLTVTPLVVNTIAINRYYLVEACRNFHDRNKLFALLPTLTEIDAFMEKNKKMLAGDLQDGQIEYAKMTQMLKRHQLGSRYILFFKRPLPSFMVSELTLGAFWQERGEVLSAVVNFDEAVLNNLNAEQKNEMELIQCGAHLTMTDYSELCELALDFIQAQDFPEKFTPNVLYDTCRDDCKPQELAEQLQADLKSVEQLSQLGVIDDEIVHVKATILCVRDLLFDKHNSPEQLVHWTPSKFLKKLQKISKMRELKARSIVRRMNAKIDRRHYEVEREVASVADELRTLIYGNQLPVPKSPRRVHFDESCSHRPGSSEINGNYQQVPVNEPHSSPRRTVYQTAAQADLLVGETSCSLWNKTKNRAEAEQQFARMMSWCGFKPQTITEQGRIQPASKKGGWYDFYGKGISDEQKQNFRRRSKRDEAFNAELAAMIPEYFGYWSRWK